MFGFMSKEVMEGLAQARKKAFAKKNRLRLHTDGDIFPIITFTDEYLTLEAANAPHVRGLVDIYDGSRHIYQALIVASEQDGDLMTYEFKRHTPALDRAPLDFDRDENTPTGFLTKA